MNSEDKPTGYCGICRKKTTSKHIITCFYGEPRNYMGCSVCNGYKRTVTKKDRS